MHPRIVVVVVSLLATVACGPSGRNGPDAHGGGGGDGSGSDCVPMPENTPATCSDGIDNNCNGVVDCADSSCSGIGNCPICGMVEHPNGMMVPLPDGIVGSACTTNAQCSGATPTCVEMECHGTYTSKLHFMGFGPTQKVASISDIQAVCVNISHEWLRDMEISLQAPSGELLRMDKFLGRTGGEVYLGHPHDTDGETDPGPEAGGDYCWKPTATNPPMLDYANANMAMMAYGGHQELPPGDYQTGDPWSTLIGATLNGDWQIVVTDLWPLDAGIIHSWSIAFNPMIVQDCSGPVIQ